MFRIPAISLLVILTWFQAPTLPIIPLSIAFILTALITTLSLFTMSEGNIRSLAIGISPITIASGTALLSIVAIN